MLQMVTILSVPPIDICPPAHSFRAAGNINQIQKAIASIS